MAVMMMAAHATCWCGNAHVMAAVLRLRRAVAAPEGVSGHRGEEAVQNGQHHLGTASEAAEHRDQVEADCEGDARHGQEKRQ